MEQLENEYLLIVVNIAWAVAGVILVRWPAQCRDYYCKNYAKGMGKTELPENWRENYLTHIPPPPFFRVVGVVFLCVASFIAYGLVSDYMSVQIVPRG